MSIGDFKPALVRPGAKFHAAQAIGTGRFYITLQDSCFGAQWVGISRLMLEWKYENAPRAFSVENLASHQVSTYVLAVRSKGKRFKFWTDVNEILDYPLYNGDTLFDDTVFELWSTVNAEFGDFAGFTFYATVLRTNSNTSTSPVSLPPTFPGRVALCETPTHILGSPHPVLRFSTTSPTCPP